MTNFSPSYVKIYSKQAQKMEHMGGSFAKAIAVAYQKADHLNTRKIETAFSDLFNSYNHFL